MNREQCEKMIRVKLEGLGFGSRLAEKSASLHMQMCIPGEYTEEYADKIATRKYNEEIQEFGRIRNDSEVKPIQVLGFPKF